MMNNEKRQIHKFTVKDDHLIGSDIGSQRWQVRSNRSSLKYATQLKKGTGVESRFAICIFRPRAVSLMSVWNLV
jgi:hypothetical protein